MLPKKERNKHGKAMKTYIHICYVNSDFTYGIKYRAAPSLIYTGSVFKDAWETVAAVVNHFS